MKAQMSQTECVNHPQCERKIKLKFLPSVKPAPGAFERECWRCWIKNVRQNPQTGLKEGR